MIIIKIKKNWKMFKPFELKHEVQSGNYLFSKQNRIRTVQYCTHRIEKKLWRFRNTLWNLWNVILQLENSFRTATRKKIYKKNAVPLSCLSTCVYVRFTYSHTHARAYYNNIVYVRRRAVKGLCEKNKIKKTERSWSAKELFSLQARGSSWL